MYAKNIAAFLKPDAKANWRFAKNDEIVRETLVTQRRSVVHPTRVAELATASAGE